MFSVLIDECKVSLCVTLRKVDARPNIQVPEKKDESHMTSH